MEVLAAATTNIAATREGERLPAFASAVDMYKTMVYSIAWQFLHDRVAADELAQDVFLQLHKNWGRIQSAAHLVFWLRKVATHRAIDAARKRKTKAETSLEETDEPTVLERVHDSFLASYLKRMVASLPEKQRSVVVLRYQEEMELDEIAEVLGMKVSTVKTQISRALELLRGKVSRRLGERERAMSNFEDDLKEALTRQTPAAGFTARVLARCAEDDAKKRTGSWRMAVAAGALLLVSGGTVYERYERQARGMEAKRRVMLAMRIAGTKLQEVQRRVRESEQVEE